MPHAFRILRTARLLESGWTRRTIAAAVSAGRLVKVRQGAFCLPDAPAEIRIAGRSRGRLACVSELARHGVFIMDAEKLHLHVDASAARFVTPVGAHRLHRRRLLRPPHPDDLAVHPLDALYDAVLCQPPRAAIATIDSAVRLGIVRARDLDELFAALPRRRQGLRRLIDPRAESGPESLMRLILRSIGRPFEPQVTIPGVGRVDFLVSERVVVECDSEAHHSSWEAQKADRRRDQAAAALGLVTYRPIAEDIMWRADEVRAAASGIIRARSRVQKAGSSDGRDG